MSENLTAIADALNVLADYLGPRDVPELTRAALNEPLDAIILFGGSILAGDSVFHEAMAHQAANHYLIAGGRGHTTPTLRAQLSKRGFDFLGDPSEALMHQRYLEYTYVDHIRLLETESTNCGSNVANSLAILQAHDIPVKRLGIIQDATMQRRMAACFHKVAPETQLVNFAAYQVHVQVWNGQLGFTKPIFGMWSMHDYITLLMGELPRLTDDAHGYGPHGQNYIAHVDIPEPVQAAYAFLQAHLDITGRPADPAFKS
ncbi:ElyC/SanA/YdcF family protein [Levilactobacillus zymae]|uniref:Protein ydcF n=1 Tax=Levilactobacillus zymae TaxID=267363 RepID=A0A1Y6K417_9LACO|nr:ElyC/SanA/YdcF family protein [Levilactobacillus zymae]SMS15294.1 Protein ydcF [Levilactobacillus zymae]